jgi:hypothetical protein
MSNPKPKVLAWELTNISWNFLFTKTKQCAHQYMQTIAYITWIMMAYLCETWSISMVLTPSDIPRSLLLSKWNMYEWCSHNVWISWTTCDLNLCWEVISFSKEDQWFKCMQPWLTLAKLLRTSSFTKSKFLTFTFFLWGKLDLFVRRT